MLPMPKYKNYMHVELACCRECHDGGPNSTLIIPGLRIPSEQVLGQLHNCGLRNHVFRGKTTEKYKLLSGTICALKCRTFVGQLTNKRKM